MMDGMAASISMAVPSGRRSQHRRELGQEDARCRRTTGTAISSAMAEVMSVPTMGIDRAVDFRCPDPSR